MSAGRIPPSSRYAVVGTAVLRADDGTEIVYLRRRLLPDPDRLALVGTHVVQVQERLDQIAAATLGDPELFWRLCDGNSAMWPDELTKRPGRSLRITLPEGFPGTSDA